IPRADSSERCLNENWLSSIQNPSTLFLLGSAPARDPEPSFLSVHQRVCMLVLVEHVSRGLALPTHSRYKMATWFQPLNGRTVESGLVIKGGWPSRASCWTAWSTRQWLGRFVSSKSGGLLQLE